MVLDDHNSTFTTPLRRVRHIISAVGYLCLFPFTVEGEELQRSPFVPLKMTLAFLISFSYVFYQGCVIWHVLGSFSWSNLKEMLAKTKIEPSNISMGAYVLTGSLSMLTMDLLFVLSGGIARRLSKVFGQLADIAKEHNHRLGRQSLADYMGYQVAALVLVAISLTVYALQGDTMYPAFVAPYVDNLAARVLNIIWFALSQFFLFWAPPMLGLESMLGYVLECCGESFVIVTDLARRHAEATKSRRGEGAFKCLDLGFRVAGIVGDTNKAVSTILVFNLGLILIIISANLFCLLDLFLEPWNNLKILFLLRHLAENAIYILSLSVMCYCGQRLENRQLEAKRALEDLSRSLSHDLRRNLQTERDIAVLVSRLSEPAPISPHSFVTVNHRGFLGIMSTAVTYLIVLLQFKTSN